MAKKRRSLYLIPLLVLLSAAIGGMYGPRLEVASAATADDDVKNSMKEFTKVYSTVEQNFADPVAALRDAGGLAVLADVDELAAWVDKMLRDETARKVAGAAARSVASAHGALPEQIAGRLLALLK